MSSYLTEYIVPTLIQCIVPTIAIIYTIMENHKLNKFNRVIPFINSDFDKYINDLSCIYIELKLYSKKYSMQPYYKDKLIPKLREDRIIIYEKIKMINLSLNRIKLDIEKSYNIYYKNLKIIESYLERINNTNETGEYKDEFLYYLKCILEYCYTIPVSIYSEINKRDIREENINSIYEEIEKIQKELNKKLGETK